MKSTAKRLLERTAHTPVAWFTCSLCGRLGHYFGQIYGHARWVRGNVERNDVTPYLHTILSGTHQVQSIKSTDDIQNTHTYRYAQLRKYDTKERHLTLGDRRPWIMEWLVATPLETSGERLTDLAWPLC